MEQNVLSRRNAHRAKSVRCIENPELGVLPFNYYGVTKNNYRYHSVGTGENQQVIVISELNKWEVIEFTHEPLLDEFWDTAHSAYSWNSFDPDKRAEDSIVGHEKELREDLASIPEEQKERYTTNYKKYYGAMLSALSRCANAAVTGPANFNVRRNNTAQSRYEGTCSEFIDWRKRAFAAIEKSIENAKPQEQKDDEAWQSLKRDILSSAQTIVDIDNGTRGYNRALFVSSIFNKVGTLAGHGNVAIVEKAIELLRELNSKHSKPIITERHKFFKLPEVARNTLQRNEEKANRENKEIPFDGGVVVLNYAEDRLQILFDKKPDEAMRNRLKRDGGLRWSPTNMAWQRQLTQNAIYTVKHYLKLENCNL